MTPLITSDELARRAGAMRVVDASWYMPDEGRDAAGEFAAGHIPGAVFFDLDKVSDLESGLPHMMPKPGAFAETMAALGIGDDTHVVVYDGAGLFSAARLWWMLRAMGYDAVQVLDGGLPRWRAEGRPLEKGAAHPAAAYFTPRPRPEMIRTFMDVKAALGRIQILDARSPGRFTGAEKEPRPGVRSGHMPGAINLHYRSLLNPDGTMKDKTVLMRLFAARGLDPGAPVIASCGSGVTAAILLLALARLGHDAGNSLYDGSWAEWGARADADVVTGA